MLLRVVGVVLVGVNYIFDINQELLVESRLENTKSRLRLDDEFDRNLASLKGLSIPDSALELPNVIFSKPWVITKLEQYNGAVFSFNLKVSLKKLSPFLLRVESDNDLVFFAEKKIDNQSGVIILKNLKTSETITLVEEKKQFKKKEEKVIQKVSLKSSARANKVSKAKKGIRLHDGDMRIYQAMVPGFSSAILRGDSVDGTITLRSGSLEEFDVSLINNNGDEKVLSFSYAEILDGGMFSYNDGEKDAHGIITNDGKKGFRVRFSTGELAGAILSFGKEGEEVSFPDKKDIYLNSKARVEFKKRALENQKSLKGGVLF